VKRKEKNKKINSKEKISAIIANLAQINYQLLSQLKVKTCSVVYLHFENLVVFSVVERYVL